MLKLYGSVVISMFVWGTSCLSQAFGQPVADIRSPDRNYETLGGVENGGVSFATGGPVLANAVLTPKASTFVLSVTLNVRLRMRDLGAFDVFISNISSNGEFYSTKVLGTISDQNLTRDFKRVRIALEDNVPVAANKRYYIGIRRRPGANCTVILGNTLDPAVLSRPEVAASGYSYSRKGGQQPNSHGVYEMIAVMQ